MFAALRDCEAGEAFPRRCGFCRLEQWIAKEMTSTRRMNAPTHAPMTVPNDMLLPEEELGEVVAADATDDEAVDADGVEEAS